MKCSSYLPAALLTAIAATALCASLQAQSPTMPRSLIVERIDLTRLATLSGNVRSAANPQNDLGPVDGSLPLDHMLLELQRAPNRSRSSLPTSTSSTLPARRTFTSG